DVEAHALREARRECAEGHHLARRGALVDDERRAVEREGHAGAVTGDSILFALIALAGAIRTERRVLIRCERARRQTGTRRVHRVESFVRASLHELIRTTGPSAQPVASIDTHGLVHRAGGMRRRST